MESIIAKFKWSHHDWMQDWPLEISDEINIYECLQEYGGLTNEDEKFLLMKAVLYALEEVKSEEEFEKYGEQVSELLNKDFSIHISTIYYWTLYSDEEFDGFRITPLMRIIWNNNIKRSTTTE